MYIVCQWWAWNFIIVRAKTFSFSQKGTSIGKPLKSKSTRKLLKGHQGQDMGQQRPAVQQDQILYRVCQFPPGLKCHLLPGTEPVQYFHTKYLSCEIIFKQCYKI